MILLIEEEMFVCGVEGMFLARFRRGWYHNKQILLTWLILFRLWFKMLCEGNIMDLLWGSFKQYPSRVHLIYFPPCISQLCNMHDDAGIRKPCRTLSLWNLDQVIEFCYSKLLFKLSWRSKPSTTQWWGNPPLRLGVGNQNNTVTMRRLLCYLIQH